MSDIHQLVYASRATFQSSDNGGGVEPEVGRILIQSRRNNPRRGLVGALYYGNGCFFQCLEGPQHEIDTLYAQLMKDPRHRDLKVLRRERIEGTSFAVWSMKYVPAANDVLSLLAEHGKQRFDPYDFDLPLVEAMVNLLHRRSIDSAESPATAGGRSAPVHAPGKGGKGAVVAWIAVIVVLAVIAVVLLR